MQQLRTHRCNGCKSKIAGATETNDEKKGPEPGLVGVVHARGLRQVETLLLLQLAELKARTGSA